MNFQSLQGMTCSGEKGGPCQGTTLWTKDQASSTCPLQERLSAQLFALEGLTKQAFTHMLGLKASACQKRTLCAYPQADRASTTTMFLRI
jgi:hypothetical protein